MLYFAEDHTYPHQIQKFVNSIDQQQRNKRLICRSWQLAKFLDRSVCEYKWPMAILRSRKVAVIKCFPTCKKETFIHNLARSANWGLGLALKYLSNGSLLCEPFNIPRFGEYFYMPQPSAKILETFWNRPHTK